MLHCAQSDGRDKITSNTNSDCVPDCVTFCPTIKAHLKTQLRITFLITGKKVQTCNVDWHCSNSFPLVPLTEIVNLKRIHRFGYKLPVFEQ